MRLLRSAAPQLWRFSQELCRAPQWYRGLQQCSAPDWDLPSLLVQRQVEAHAGLENLHHLASRMSRQLSPEAMNRIMGFGCHVIERAPVVRDEISRVQSVEQGECVTAGEVALSKPGLPPRSMADWQQRHIQPPSGNCHVILNEMGAFRSQSGITGKETGELISIK